MSQENGWLFDAMWELSDIALESGMPTLADKLEEAMDAYLAERGDGPGSNTPNSDGPKLIGSDIHRKLPEIPQKSVKIANTKPVRVGTQLLRKNVKQEDLSNLWVRPELEPGFISSRPSVLI